MNTSQAAALINQLHGAYPGTYFDGAVGEAFANSFITNDYELSRQAVDEWVSSMTRFPTIAELNATIRRLRRVDEERALPPAEKVGDLTREQRREAFARGYEKARWELGDTPEEIAAKVERRFAEMDALIHTRAERKVIRR